MAKSSNSWQTPVVLVFILAIIGIAIYFGTQKKPDTSQGSNTTISGNTPNMGLDDSSIKSKLTTSYKLQNSSDPALGPSDAKVTVTEYFDFECPACQTLARQVLPTLEQQYSQKVRFVYKQFPLPQHNSGAQAAIASICAQDQGKFFEFRDLLVSEYPKWAEKDALLSEYASKVGLDMTKFNSCRTSTAPREKIKQDFEQGVNKGIDSTPTLFINDKKIVGVAQVSEYQKVIDELLK